MLKYDASVRAALHFLFREKPDVPAVGHLL
jgi:hypothetical protein